jgi:hypothetical protein
MGWSCNAAASLTLDAIVAIQKKLGAEGTNSIMIDGKQVGFWETSGREHDDGAITGSVFTLLESDLCRKTGSFRIEPNGKITRFSSIPRRLLIEAEKKGAEEFTRRYGITQAEKENVKV